MRYIFFKPAVILTFLLTVCIALIRAQPYDDSQLRAFLMPPDGCPMPCFMGIRPGVTTMEEALAILEAHEWVGTLQDNIVVNDRSVPANRYGDILWEWSGLQPPLIDENTRGHLRVFKGQVNGIYVSTRITLGELWRLLGPPDIGLVVRSDMDETYRELVANYTAIALGVEVDWHCPVNATTYWHAPLRIILPFFSGLDEDFMLAYPHC